MRGLTVIVAGTDRARLRAALSLAATQAALGARARLFLEGEAVAVVGHIDAADDLRHVAAGLPALGELIDTGLALGVTITLCQSGIALAGIDLPALDTRLEAGGLTSIMGTLGDDRLVVF